MLSEKQIIFSLACQGGGDTKVLNCFEGMKGDDNILHKTLRRGYFLVLMLWSEMKRVT